MKIKVGGGGDSYRCAFSFHGRERFTTAFLSPELREEGIDAWMAATTLWINGGNDFFVGWLNASVLARIFPPAVRYLYVLG